MICEALEMSWTELQETPQDVIAYRIAVSRRRAEIREASQPRGS